MVMVMSEFNSVSIIVPALNEEKHIKQCLDSLFSLNTNKLKIEVIVMDNGSSDNTVKIAQHSGATVQIQPDVNVSTLRNLGVSISSGDLLAFVDADCVVEHNWLINAIRCILRESADAVGSFHNIPKESGWIGRISTLIQGSKVGADINYIPSGNMLIIRTSYEEIGGFNSSLETGEDVDLCRRLKEKGYTIFNDPIIKSTHYGSPGNIKEMFLREIWHGKTMLNVFMKDFPKIRNWRVVLFSTANLVFLAGIIIGICLVVFIGETKILVISCVSYLFINLLVTIRDCVRLKCNFFPLIFYIIIYGIARSVSLFRSFLLVLSRLVFAALKV